MLKHSRLLLAAIVVAGCATVAVDLPSISESDTSSHDPGRIVWRDLLTTTPVETQKFYGELFGWTFERPGIDLGFGSDDSYLMIRHGGRLIGGLFDARTIEAEDNVSQWVTYFSTDDVAAAVARSEAEGAIVVTPPTPLATRGTVAVLRDPEGALFAVVRANGGDPAAEDPAYNQFLWDELWTTDVDAAGGFYGRVFGFRTESFPGAEQGLDYQVLATEDQARAGIMTNPFDSERPVWINYLRVADPAAVAARVDGLGGRIIVDAQPRDVGGTVALVAGPSGAGIALQTWPLEKEDAE